MRFLFALVVILMLVSSAYAEVTCPAGFVLEQNDMGVNCRNKSCDMAQNLYGKAIDGGATPEAINNGTVDSTPGVFLAKVTSKDFAGMPRPKIKDWNGKWVGWSVGAFQCPPDPLGIHPNPDWPCGFKYCPGKPQHIRIEW